MGFTFGLCYVKCEQTFSNVFCVLRIVKVSGLRAAVLYKSGIYRIMLAPFLCK